MWLQDFSYVFCFEFFYYGFVCFWCYVDSRVRNYKFLYGMRIYVSYFIVYKFVVVGIYDIEFLDIQMLQKFVYVFCLEKFSFGFVGGEGLFCEQEVGNENVKGVGEVGYLLVLSVRVEFESMKEY